MSDPGSPGRRGRHSTGWGAGGFSTPGVPSTPPVPGLPPVPDPGFADAATGGISSGDHRYGEDRPRFEPWADTGASTGGFRRVSGVLDRHEDRTGPLAEPDWWSYDSSDHPDHPRARHAEGDDRSGAGEQGAAHRPDTEHPSAPLPPLPPRPTGVWNRLQPRPQDPDDDATVAQRLDLDDVDPRGPATPAADDDWDRTGGLEVIGAHVEDDAPRRRRGLRRRAPQDRGPARRRPLADAAQGDADDQDAPTGGLHPGPVLPHDDALLDDGVHDHHGDDDHHDGDHHDDGRDHRVPDAPYGRRSDRRRGRRRPWAVLLSLLVLAGLLVGIAVGVQSLIGLFQSEDYTGQGTGEVEIRISEGDTLTDIARTLVGADVIASTGPFVDAAEDRPEATGIQPGRYGLRLQMSGAAALDLLLSDESLLRSRVTVPEGLTVARTLQRLATETGRPLEEFQAAAADLPALGLPAYANGQLEGFLFPATYDVDPEDTAAEILRSMVQQFTSVATGLQLEQRAAAAGRTPAEIVTVASMVQSETRLDAERPDVAQVIYNRLDRGIALGIDATLAFGLDKSGNDLTVSDLQTDGPYNTRTRTGLPPTAISSPGEASLEAALAPSTGNLLYYVLESADGAHFFTADYAEFQAARQRCAEAGLGCGG